MLECQNAKLLKDVKEKVLRRNNRAQRLFFNKWSYRRLQWYIEDGDSRRQSLKGGQAIKATETEG